MGAEKGHAQKTHSSLHAACMQLAMECCAWNACPPAPDEQLADGGGSGEREDGRQGVGVPRDEAARGEGQGCGSSEAKHGLKRRGRRAQVCRAKLLRHPEGSG